jgi:acetyltransferase-like isoleucine patch superfamily enzyme
VKELAKSLARFAALLLISPLLLSYWCWSLALGPDRALEGSSQTISLVPGLIGVYLRRAFLMRVLAHCHHTATIEFGTLFSQTGARLDENVYVGPRCQLGLVHIGRDTLLGPGVHVPSGAHTHGTADPTRPIREQNQRRSCVSIGAGAWIGSAAIVMADVGQGTVVGAGAVVTKPLPPHVVAVGVPARVVRQRDGDLPKLS